MGPKRVFDRSPLDGHARFVARAPLEALDNPILRKRAPDTRKRAQDTLLWKHTVIRASPPNGSLDVLGRREPRSNTGRITRLGDRARSGLCRSEKLGYVPPAPRSLPNAPACAKAGRVLQPEGGEGPRLSGCSLSIHTLRRSAGRRRPRSFRMPPVAPSSS